MAPTKFERMSAGERVHWLLVVRQMTQTELATRVGIKQSAISNLITDKARKPSAQTLLSMARILGCPPDFILNGIGNPLLPELASGQTAELMRLFKRLTPARQNQVLVFARLLSDEPFARQRPNPPTADWHL